MSPARSGLPLDGETRPDAETTSRFTLRLENFEGPFDLLLQLIAKHKLDITEVALSQVTDEFIGYVKAAGAAWDLEETSQFVVVAATLLDLKAARLLPSGEVEDPEDLALLEARDLLFARLLQYRAFKQVAVWLAALVEREKRSAPRPGGLEPAYSGLLPEVIIRQTPEQFAQLAARVLTPKQVAEVSLTHLHAPRVSVREQARLLVERLRLTGTATFRALVADAPERLTTVCRFLALLELYREQAVSFEQLTPLGELTVRWSGGEDTVFEISEEFDGARSDSDAVATMTDEPADGMEQEDR